MSAMKPNGPDAVDVPFRAFDGIGLPVPPPCCLDNFPAHSRHLRVELLRGFDGRGQRTLKAQPATAREQVRDGVTGVARGAGDLMPHDRSEPFGLDDLTA